MYSTNRRIFAGIFLAIFSVQTFYPGMAYALTSGPSQPEMEKFQPAGVSDMVDLFSGDAKYNIPLMDVGGYPVNLSYQSGTGLEDEASWVGNGWTLNPGSVNRNLRGVPDDFKGDGIEKYYTRKDFKKVGGQVVIKPSALSWEVGAASLKMDVYKDNYYGIGASVGANIDLSTAKNSESSLTAGLNIDINSDVRDGLDIAPTLSLSNAHDEGAEHSKIGLSGGFRYNTRDGLKSLTLGATYNSNKQVLYAPINVELSSTHYFGQTYTPTIPINTTSSNTKFSFDVGPSIFGGYVGVGGSGYVSKQSIATPLTTTPSYGYIYYLNGRHSLDAQLDFNREKDGTFFQSSPAIPIPVATQDFFMATGQLGSRQFRAHYAGNMVVFDKISQIATTDISAGVTAGFGALFKVGGRVSLVDGSTVSKKWITNTSTFTSKAEPAFIQPEDEPMYLKQVGECTSTDENFVNKLGNDEVLKVRLYNNGLSDNFVHKETADSPIPILKKEAKSREKRTGIVSYLTALQASKYGLDKKINDFKNSPVSASQTERYDDVTRKQHHISEIRITDNEGKRMVYGLPVYNLSQAEYTFSCAPPAAADKEKVRQTGIIDYTKESSLSDANPAHAFGRDELLIREKTPAYATSFLLTGVLSSDYVDVKDDGITDDDLGTAYKFNYTKLPSTYQWRTPCVANPHPGTAYPVANYNEGFLSDPKDDKASFVYGQKEVWYLKAIESKTLIAVFKTSARQDALGVGDLHGNTSTLSQLQKLDQIVLYSKAEYQKDPANAVPIKTVYFEYDYSLYPQMPNNSGTVVTTAAGINLNLQKGKLTLKKVYFTFGRNTRGMTNPYEFQYDIRNINDGGIAGLPDIPATDPDYDDHYIQRGSDRWGTYKKSFYNPVTGTRGINNSEYSYTLQQNENTSWDERTLMNRFASKWQLNKIITPAGSVIDIEYESDDYAYVQNRKAMQMCMLKGVRKNGASSGLIKANQVLVELPKEVSSTEEFKNKYLKGQTSIFFKVFADVDNRGHNEYVHGYAEIDLDKTQWIPNTRTALVGLKLLDNNTYNPIAKAAWQMLRTDLKQYAYDNYDNTEVADGQAAIRSIVQSLGNLRELTRSFEERAENRSFANNIDFSRSMIRLINPDGKKIGGGARVHKVTISDEWHEMTATAGQKTAVYGQEYNYNTTDNDGNEISSGVASYEPQIGNEENPFHEPLNYTEKVYWSSDRYHYVEKPFCESWFPAAQVGYSQVKITDFGVDMEKSTGYTVNTFYTAKDFPTLVENTTLDQRTYENSMILQLFTAIVVKRVQTSQGFKIELNDMHGKPRSVDVFNNGGNKISSTEYFYNVKDENAEQKELNNKVSLLQKDGSIATNKTIATDIEMITDLRESDSQSLGVGIGAYAGSLMGIFIPIPYGSVRITPSKSANTFRSASMVKIIHRYGMVKKIRTMQDGSVTEAENLLWDGETGEAVLVKKQNEFNLHSYVFTYPAWMVESYQGMGGAYRNISTVLSGFSAGADGTISTSFNDFLCEGDELGEITTAGSSVKGWVIKSGANYKLINVKGEIQQASGTFIVLRSGWRNMLNANAGTVVFMSNPIAGGSLVLNIDRRVLDAKATEYSNEWAVPVNNKLTLNKSNSPISEGCMQAFIYGLISKKNINTTYNERAIFTTGVGMKANTILTEGFKEYCEDYFYDDIPASQVPYYLENPHYTVNGSGRSYYLSSGDVGRISESKIVFDFVHSEFNTMLNSALTPAQMEADLTSMITTPSGPYMKYCFVLNEYPGSAFTFRRRDVPNMSYSCSADVPPGETSTILLKFHIEKPGESQYVCQDPLNNIINPYVEGLLGNWRPKTANVYATNRIHRQSQSTLNGSTDIRNAGYYANYTPFWQFSANGIRKDLTDVSNRWVTSNTSIYYDQKGNEVESKDALGHYGAALFGYQQSSAIAIAANSRRNEIAYDGFEDYYFDQTAPAEDCPAKRHFDWQISKSSGNTWCSNVGCISPDKAHTGRYSYALWSSVNINRTAGLSAPPTQNYTMDYLGRYVLYSNELAQGFAPVPDNQKEYLLSMWVYDREPRSLGLSNLNITVNGIAFDAMQATTAIEGWKRIEMKFKGGSFSLQMTPSGTVYIDDFRIQPLDAQMSAYAYDDRNLRLMAQLDENNYATFYEYDDEGTPIRVKKETEKGIVTLKESRKFLKQR